MEPVNNNTTSNQPPQPPVQSFVAAPTPGPVPIPSLEKKSRAASFFGLVILIQVLLVVFSWFAPIPQGCGGRAGSGPSSCATALPALLFMPILGMSAVVGISFLVTVVSSIKGKKFFVQLFGIIIGLCGGFFLFTVGMIAGFIGSIRATGSV